ncbi:MAG: DUF4321 domain-containing protein [Clostridiales bacterium]|mgnify:CR=1 FL=1|jgi:hypothetical protein|nr:DUF4321 domain-containing protein [Clostridiales bacterium]
MRRAARRGTGRLLLLLLCGLIIGTIIGHILSLVTDSPIFTFNANLGMDVDKPITLNLKLFTITLGLTMHLNFGTLIGVIIGLALYFRS